MLIVLFWRTLLSNSPKFGPHKSLKVARFVQTLNVQLPELFPIYHEHEFFPGDFVTEAWYGLDPHYGTVERWVPSMEAPPATPAPTPAANPAANPAPTPAPTPAPKSVPISALLDLLLGAGCPALRPTTSLLSPGLPDPRQGEGQAGEDPQDEDGQDESTHEMR